MVDNPFDLLLYKAIREYQLGFRAGLIPTEPNFTYPIFGDHHGALSFGYRSAHTFFDYGFVWLISERKF
jgi:hypothetical protein